MTTPSLPHLRDLAERARDSRPQWYEFHNYVGSFLSPTEAEYSIAASPDVVIALISLVEQQTREIGELRADVERAWAKRRLYFHEREIAKREAERGATITTLRAALAEALEIGRTHGGGQQRERIAALEEHL